MPGSNIYYVNSVGGNNSFPGTSWDQAWATLSHAVLTAPAGAKILVSAGEFNSGTTQIALKAGQTIVGQGMSTRVHGSNSSGVVAVNVDDVTISDLLIEQTLPEDPLSKAAAVLMGGISKNVLLERVTFAGQAGVVGNFDGLTVRRSLFAVYRLGIDLVGTTSASELSIGECIVNVIRQVDTSNLGAAAVSVSNAMVQIVRCSLNVRVQNDGSGTYFGTRIAGTSVNTGCLLSECGIDVFPGHGFQEDGGGGPPASTNVGVQVEGTSVAQIAATRIQARQGASVRDVVATGTARVFVGRSAIHSSTGPVTVET